MVVPDFELICEIMLVAEGFQEARLLARKFITPASSLRYIHYVKNSCLNKITMTGVSEPSSLSSLWQGH